MNLQSSTVIRKQKGNCSSSLKKKKGLFSLIPPHQQLTCEVCSSVHVLFACKSFQLNNCYISHYSAYFLFIQFCFKNLFLLLCIQPVHFPIDAQDSTAKQHVEIVQFQGWTPRLSSVPCHYNDTMISLYAPLCTCMRISLKDKLNCRISRSQGGVNVILQNIARLLSRQAASVYISTSRAQGLLQPHFPANTWHHTAF